MFSHCCPLSRWGFSCGETGICHSMIRETRSAEMHSMQLHKHLHKKDVLSCGQIIILLKLALIQMGFDQYLIALDIPLNWCIPKENRSFSYHPFFSYLHSFLRKLWCLPCPRKSTVHDNFLMLYSGNLHADCIETWRKEKEIWTVSFSCWNNEIHDKIEVKSLFFSVSCKFCIRPGIAFAFVYILLHLHLYCLLP